MLNYSLVEKFKTKIKNKINSTVKYVFFFYSQFFFNHIRYYFSFLGHLKARNVLYKHFSSDIFLKGNIKFKKTEIKKKLL